MQLSKLESMVYETLKKNNIVTFRTKDIELLFKINKTKTYNILKALKKKGAIKKIKGGFYAIYGANEFVIGSSLNWPSYLSFWSAMNYYGFTDQLPRTIFYATTRYRKSIDNYKYITISKKRFFGYARVGGITIAEKEKAIIDSLLFPKYAGGVNELRRCIKAAFNKLDRAKLIDYAVKIGSKAVLRRLGFILELTGCEAGILKKLHKRIGRGYELLDPSLKKRNNLNKKWLLDINDDINR